MGNDQQSLFEIVGQYVEGSSMIRARMEKVLTSIRGPMPTNVTGKAELTRADLFGQLNAAGTNLMAINDLVSEFERWVGYSRTENATVGNNYRTG